MIVHLALNLAFVVLCVRASQLANIQKSFNVRYNEIPKLNFMNPDNSIQLLGNASGLSFYRYQGQQNFTGNIPAGSNTHGLIYYSNDTFVELASPSNDTEINKIVPIGVDSFILSGLGHLDGQPLAKQLKYNISDFSVTPIFDQELQQVETIFVDDTLVYFGGNFTFSNGSTNGHSIISWDYATNTVAYLPFLGFGNSSQVNSIVKLNDDNLLFIGKFSTLDDSTLLLYNTTKNSTNYSSSNATQIELSQQVPLRLATWAQTDGSLDHEELLCANTDNDAWFHTGNTGEFTANLEYQIFPSKLKIYNSHNFDNSVAAFRIISYPSNGIMNLTYIDPVSGEIMACDAVCPLLSLEKLSEAANNSTVNSANVAVINNNTTDIKWSTDYQEFAFVNQVGILDIQFIGLASYGHNLALSGFQLFQDRYSVFANNTLNQPDCGYENLVASSVLSNNNWYGTASETYISTFYTPEKDTVPLVEFYPNINHPGNYTINIYTPGCLLDNTCANRGIVNVTIWDANTNDIFATSLIYQTNNEFKFDQIYSGYLNITPKITLEYHSALINVNTPIVVVADKVDLIASFLDVDQIYQTVNESSSVKLNGLFQYQLSNFTGSSNTSDQKVTNTSLNTFAVDNYPESVALFGDFSNNTLYLGASSMDLSQISLNDTFDISAISYIAANGTVFGVTQSPGGTVFFGEFNTTSGTTDTLVLNGTLSSFGNLDAPVQTLSNITIGGSDLLVFNNEQIFNVSSGSYLSNSSSFALSLWAAGSNNFNDTLFSGAISINEYVPINGTAAIFGNTTIQPISFNDSEQPYLGVYLNQSKNAYAFKSQASNQLTFGNSLTSSWTFPNTIDQLYYSGNTSLLIGSTFGDDISTELFLMNLTTMETIANKTFDPYIKIEAVVGFPKNSTLLVSGNFTISDTNCTSLCFYNYMNDTWSSFNNNSISGNVTDMKFDNQSLLWLSGSFETVNSTSINLASLNLTSNEIFVAKRGLESSLDSFDYNNDTIVTWNDTNIFMYSPQNWTSIDLPKANTSSRIDEVNFVESEEHLNELSLLLYGMFFTESYGLLDSILYSEGKWLPYFSSYSSNDAQTNFGNLFINKDVSSFYFSPNFLPSPEKNETISSSTTSSSLSGSSKTSNASSSSSTKKLNKGTHSKIDRGFVVLIGLALAIATLIVVALFGVLVAYILNDNNGDYKPIDSRLDENEMVETVPPEKLMKFI